MSAVTERVDIPLEQLRETMARIADRTLDYDFSVWFWGDAIAMDGLLDASEALGDDELAAAVRTYVGRWVRRVESAGVSWGDHLTPGSAAIRVAQRYGDDAPLEAVRRLADFMREGPRSRWLDAPLRLPDRPLERNAVLVDSLYHEGTLFCRLAQANGDDSYLAAGLHRLEATVAVLLAAPDQRFFPQGVDTASRKVVGTGWGRGQGWALLGLVDSLELIPSSRPEYERIAGVVSDLSTRLVPLQDETGFWRTIVHNREAYLETSTAAFFAAVFYKSIRLGLLDRDPFAAIADRALAALLTRVDGEGNVFGVSGLSPPDEDEGYLRRPTEVNEWGQGSALRAIAERLRTVG